jgi:hypothetical protein
MFERETRREKILEARNREMKLKEKAGTNQESEVSIFDSFSRKFSLNGMYERKKSFHKLKEKGRSTRWRTKRG